MKFNVSVLGMHQYISDTEYAVSHLMAALVIERAELAWLLEEQAAALLKEAYFDLAFLQREMHPSANFWYGELMEAHGKRNALAACRKTPCTTAAV